MRPTHRTFRIGRFAVDIIVFAPQIHVYRVKYTPKEIEKYRLKNFPSIDVKIGRVKALRNLSDLNLKGCLLYVETFFEDNGRGNIRR
jgi:hypothetical protein